MIKVYEYMESTGFNNVKNGKFTYFSKKNPSSADVIKAFEILANTDGDLVVEYDGWEYYYEWKNDFGTGRIAMNPIDVPDYIQHGDINAVVKDILVNVFGE